MPTNEKGRRTVPILSCEHGGNEVPAEFASLFQGREDVLASHRGWDPGALEMARYISLALGAPLVHETITRQLVEQNRSRNRSSVFSGISSVLPPDVRARLLVEIYDPFHRRMLEEINRILAPVPPPSAGAFVAHFSIHSFTPVLNGNVRTADIGILYDPRRPAERSGALVLLAKLHALLPDLRIRRNYPYTGYSDGHTTALRKRFPDPSYTGFEIEVNQKFFLDDRKTWQRIRDALALAIGEYCAA